MLLFFLLPCTSVFIPVFSQQGNNWYFGSYAGLSFNTSPPTVLKDGRLNSNEGCATISDSTGELLFYTDGTYVYTKAHTVMPNGTDLTGHPSSSNSAIIIPQPGSSFLYYIFTTDAVENSLANGYRYSIVDMRLNNGLGDVTVKNVLLNAKCTEKLTAAAHANGGDVWIITIEMGGNSFKTYRLSCNGLKETPVVSNAGLSYNDQGKAIGCLKASPDHKKLATTRIGEAGWELFDFDNSTGQVSNAQFIATPELIPFGVEFSPNSQLVYVSGRFIYQFRITVPDAPSIEASRYAVETSYPDNKPALQLGPDNKIYSGNFYTSVVNVIHNPDEFGPACNYQKEAIDLGLGHTVNRSFPVFYKGVTNNRDVDFTFSSLADCRTVQFNATTRNPSLTEWRWDFGDGTGATGQTVTHTFPANGDDFHVVITATDPLQCGVRRTKMTVVTFANPALKAGFTFQASCGNKEVFFQDTSLVSAGKLVAWQWDFGDGTASTQKDPSHVYTSFGNYTVRLFITADDVCKTKDTVVQAVSVSAKPNADFRTSELCVNRMVAFTNTSSVEEGKLVKWQWTIGRESCAQKDTSIRFAAAGSYPVQLVVGSDDNCADTITKIISVETKPIADFVVAGGCQDEVVDLQNKAAIEFGSIKTDWWDFGNGATTVESNPRFSYPSVGNYTVRHVAVSQGGCVSDTVKKSILIESVPTVAFSFDSACFGKLTHFENKTTNDFGAITKWSWDFGDGITSSVAEPLHTFHTYGRLDISLTATTKNGCTAQNSKNLMIEKVVITAGNDTIAVSNEPIQLNASGGRSYQWIPSMGLNVDTIASPVAVLQHDQTYFIRGVTEAGCVGYDTLKIAIFSKAGIYVPTAFTPDNNGRNDLFGPAYVGIGKLYYFIVYNRWGQTLFSTTERSGKWDGTFLGRLQEAGVYVWIVKALDYQGKMVEKKGTVVLIR